MEKCKIVFNGNGCNKAIYGLSHSFALFHALPVYICSLDIRINTCRIIDRKCEEVFCNFPGFLVVFDTLQYLSQDYPCKTCILFTLNKAV